MGKYVKFDEIGWLVMAQATPPRSTHPRPRRRLTWPCAEQHAAAAVEERDLAYDGHQLDRPLVVEEAEVHRAEHRHHGHDPGELPHALQISVGVIATLEAEVVSQPPPAPMRVVGIGVDLEHEPRRQDLGRFWFRSGAARHTTRVRPVGSGPIRCDVRCDIRCTGGSRPPTPPPIGRGWLRRAEDTLERLGVDGFDMAPDARRREGGHGGRWEDAVGRCVFTTQAPLLRLPCDCPATALQAATAVLPYYVLVPDGRLVLMLHKP